MSDPALFRNLSDENLVEQYPEKLTDIHSYAKAEIIEFLAPQSNINGEVDTRRDLLSALREKLCETFCVMFPAYGTRELFNRRLLRTCANDIYCIGISIRNSDIDKGIKSVFKPSTTQPSQNDAADDATTDVSMIEQSDDIMEVCLLLRDSVVSLKGVITNLEVKVTGLHTHIDQLKSKLDNQNTTTNNSDATGDAAATDENGPIQTQDNQQGATVSNQPILNAVGDGNGQPPGILRAGQQSATSTYAQHRARHDVYIGNMCSTTTEANVRTHLESIGVTDVISVSKIPDESPHFVSFRVRINDITIRDNVYNYTNFDGGIVVKPYRFYNSTNTMNASGNETRPENTSRQQQRPEQHAPLRSRDNQPRRELSPPRYRNHVTNFSMRNKDDRYQRNVSPHQQHQRTESPYQQHRRSYSPYQQQRVAPSYPRHNASTSDGNSLDHQNLNGSSRSRNINTIQHHEMPRAPPVNQYPIYYYPSQQRYYTPPPVQPSQNISQWSNESTNPARFENSANQQNLPTNANAVNMPNILNIPQHA